MDIEQRLRTDLADRAHEIDSAPDLMDSVLVGHRRQNRRRAGLLAVGVCAAVAAVAIPLVTDGGALGGTGRGGEAERTASTVGYEAYPVGPRGDLTADAAYLDGLLARDWYPAPEMPDPAPETRQVLFAGTVPGGVRALVSGWEDGRRTGLWLYGGPGAGPAELESLGDAAPLPEAEPITFLSPVDGRGALVVLAEPGDLIEVSKGVEVAADGSTVRAPFEPVGNTEGLAVVDAAGLSPRTLEVRVSRDGSVRYEGPSGGVELGGRLDFDPSSALEGATGDVDPDLVRQLVQGVIDELGLTGDQVTADVLWGGPIGNGNRPGVLAAVVGVRLPSGAVVAVGGYSDVQQADGGDAWTTVGTCLRQILPAGTDLTSVAMRCDLYSLADGAGLGSRLAVIPPAGATELRLVGVSGSVLDTRPVEGPAWVGPAPDGLGSVIALDGDGEVVAEIPLGAVESLRD
jgi:hypothetical protein